nr:zinc finger protein 74-like [Symphalangus syndactylus]
MAAGGRGGRGAHARGTGRRDAGTKVAGRTALSFQDPALFLKENLEDISAWGLPEARSKNDDSLDMDFSQWPEIPTKKACAGLRPYPTLAG